MLIHTNHISCSLKDILYSIVIIIVKDPMAEVSGCNSRGARSCFTNLRGEGDGDRYEVEEIIIFLNLIHDIFSIKANSFFVMSKCVVRSTFLIVFFPYLHMTPFSVQV